MFPRFCRKKYKAGENFPVCDTVVTSNCVVLHQPGGGDHCSPDICPLEEH